MWIYIVIPILVLIAVVALILLLRLKKINRKSGYDQSDALTGLGNKKYMRVSYEHRISGYRSRYCLAYIACDILKATQKLGTEKANELQKVVAKILNDASGDYDYSARIDDGVFTFCFRHENTANANKILNHIVESLNNYEYKVAGETSFPFRAGLYKLNNDDSFDVALANAKLGYNYATENMINLCICTKDLLRNESARKRLRTKLSHAIDNKEFDMFLQFIFDIKEGKFTSAEVLSRWNSPQEGFLMPAHYINDMRITGIIGKFDYYMLDKTCALLEKWEKSGNNDLRLSCNITRITISSDEFMQKFYEIMKKYNFNHDRLMLEITEDALVDNQAVAYRNIVDCKSAGIHIAIDDFGMGHSSLSDLCDYPVDIIKIDRDIITKSTTGRGEALLHSVIQLAHDLGMKTVCEGVETEDQNIIIQKNGCDYIQGYFYSYVFPIKEGMEYYKNYDANKQ